MYISFVSILSKSFFLILNLKFVFYLNFAYFKSVVCLLFNELVLFLQIQIVW